MEMEGKKGKFIFPLNYVLTVRQGLDFTKFGNKRKPRNKLFPLCRLIFTAGKEFGVSTPSDPWHFLRLGCYRSDDKHPPSGCSPQPAYSISVEDFF
jgi:hypothetical protein